MIDAVDHHVDLAVVEKIAKSRAAGRKYIRQAGADDCWNHLKLLSLVRIAEEQRTFRPGRAPVMLIRLLVDVTTHRHHVLPPVIVIVDELRAPAQKWPSQLGEPKPGGNL